MSEIKLIDDWVVVVDDLNYSLAKKIQAKPKDNDDTKKFVYKYYGYYGSLSNALYALCDRLTRDALKSESPITLKEAVDIITDSYDRISNLLKECLDGR